jgi:hypothetical protein
MIGIEGRGTVFLGETIRKRGMTRPLEPKEKAGVRE